MQLKNITEYLQLSKTIVSINILYPLICLCINKSLHLFMVVAQRKKHCKQFFFFEENKRSTERKKKEWN